MLVLPHSDVVNAEASEEFPSSVNNDGYTTVSEPRERKTSPLAVHATIGWEVLSDYQAADFGGVKATEILVYLRDEWGLFCDGMIDEGVVHPSDYLHEGPDNYIVWLKNEIRKDGFRHPLVITEDKSIIDGHHRAVAAIQLRHPMIPLHIVSRKPTDS